MRKTFQKRIVRLFICLLFLLVVLAFCYFENNAITVSEFDIASEKLPERFDDYVIVHVSDLHNKMFGENQHRLINRIKAENPDIIVITGDLIDSNKPDVDAGLLFVSEAVKIAPVYFVTGNHDNWLSDTDTFHLFQGLKQLGVVVLKDEAVLLAEDGEAETEPGELKVSEYIRLIGIDDDTQAMKSRLEETMHKLTEEPEALPAKASEDIKEPRPFTVVLAHEPQLFPIYSDYNVDLVLSGHAHGGQFRIPLIGGFVAPDQGFLPEYTKGLYEENGTSMIVSCGLGNSVVGQRLLNRPELVKIRLKCN